jgi:hypothetical protein
VHQLFEKFFENKAYEKLLLEIIKICGICISDTDKIEKAIFEYVLGKRSGNNPNHSKRNP